MEVLFFALIAVVLVAAILKFISTQGGREQGEVVSAPVYTYTKKRYIMTQSEAQCFRRLQNIAHDRYYVFPQVHVSSLLDHATAKQNWSAALAKVQRKSVDFVLVDKDTLETCYAIELDDSTHDRATRVKRDTFIEEIFRTAKLPLVRLRSIHAMSDEDIIQYLKAARESAL